MPVIDLRLFDGDGCIFNPTMMSYLAEDRANAETKLIAHELIVEIFNKLKLEDRPEITPHAPIVSALERGNITLFQHLVTDIPNINGQKLNVMCGSNRLSNNIDSQNSRRNSTGSFFPVLVKLTELLKNIHPEAELDTFLLADVFCNLNPGEAFQQALISKDGKHPDCPLEHTKILWIYVLAQYLAIKFPNDEIVCSFYDDKQSILNGLDLWMQKNSNLIPKTVKFRLHHYDGGEVTLQSEHIGSRDKPDTAFAETTNILAYMCGIAPNTDWNTCGVVPEIRLKPELVTNDKIEEVRSKWSSLVQQSRHIAEEHNKTETSSRLKRCGSPTPPPPQRASLSYSGMFKKEVSSSDDEDEPVILNTISF